MTSGGYRPTAPQNNTGVSATGGAGSANGQPNRTYTGFAYGENKNVNEQMAAQPMASAAQAPQEQPNIPMPQDVNDLNLLTESQRAYEPITTGVDIGPGAGSEILPRQYREDSRQMDNEDIVMRYLPSLVEAAKIQGAPDSYKSFVNYLVGKLQ